MLSTTQIAKIISIFKPYHPKRIGVFGSVSRNEDTEKSDVDILYQFKKPITLYDKVKIKEDLENMLKKSVDLVSEKSINPEIRKYIIKDLKIIYEN